MFQIFQNKFNFSSIKIETGMQGALKKQADNIGLRKDRAWIDIHPGVFPTLHPQYRHASENP